MEGREVIHSREKPEQDDVARSDAVGMRTKRAEPAARAVVVAADGEVRDAVFAAAAALDVRPVSSDVAGLGALWRSAGTIFVDQELAPAVADLAPAPRDDVFLVGTDPAELGRWSMPLGAGVVVLPEGRAWLSSVLARGSAASRAPVVAVLGGSGGIGASTLAAALAVRAVGMGHSVALVDVDPSGGGIDLLLGAERVPGWRWPRLSGAQGYLGDLRPYLPEVDGVALLSMARGPGLDVAREPLAAVLGSLCRSFDLVVIDPGRGLGAAARESVRLATEVLLVVGSSLRSVAAARQVADVLELADASVVLRPQPGGSVPLGAVAETLGLPVIARLEEEPRLRAAAEAGDRPVGRRRGRRGYTGACDRLLEALFESELAS